MQKYKKTYWLKSNELSQIPTFEYWNNKEIEKGKIWSIPNDDFRLLEANFLAKGLYQQFCQLTKGMNFENKTIASLASGNCILESLIVKNNTNLKKFYCLEMSEHRIHNYAPKILNYYKIDPSKIELCLGSFYELKLEKKSIDYILLSQAYHHADNPKKLLSEIKRVLKPNGYLIIIGEHHFNIFTVAKVTAKHLAKYFLNYNNYRIGKTFIPKWQDLFPPCLEKGDIHYSVGEYKNSFETMYFNHKRKIFPEFKNQGFILTNSESVNDKL